MFPDPSDTCRIHPDMMAPLQSAALLVTETSAADLLPTARTLVPIRHVAHQVAPEIRKRPTKQANPHEVIGQYLPLLPAGLEDAGMAFPGIRRGASTAVDMTRLTVDDWLDRTILVKHAPAKATPTPWCCCSTYRYNGFDT